MLTLTLDTSTHRGTVALSENTTVLEDIFWDKSSSHSEHLVGEIRSLYLRAKKNIADTRLLICGVGPGSFTGLRVALSFSKALAYSLNIPVIPIETCWAIALQTDPLTSSPIGVVLDAQKNMFFMGKYIWQNGNLHSMQDVCLGSEDTFLKSTTTPTLYISNVPEVFQKNSLPLSPHIAFPSARLIFEYVSAYPENHKSITWNELTPLYLRASAAEEVLLLKKSTTRSHE